MKKPKLEEKILYRLFEFAQDFINAEGDSGRRLADKAAYQYVDTINFEDIHLREVYTLFYENEKERGKDGKYNFVPKPSRMTGKLIS